MDRSGSPGMDGHIAGGGRDLQIDRSRNLKRTFETSGIGEGTYDPENHEDKG